MNQTNQENKNENGLMARMGFALADWSEKWFPDAYIFAAIAVVIVGLGACHW